MGIEVTASESFAGVGTVDGDHAPEGFSVSTGASWRKRPGGPKKATDAGSRGGAMLISRTDADYIYSANQDGTFWAGGWIFIDERTQIDGSYGTAVTIPLNIADNYGQVGCRVEFDVATRSVVAKITDYPVDGTPVVTTSAPLPAMDCQWVFVLFAFNVTTWEARWYYQLPGGNLTQWVAKTGMGHAYGQQPQQIRFGQKTHAFFLSYARWQGRLGIPSYGTFTAFTDFPTDASFTAAREWVDPPTDGNVWHVKRTAVGTGDGLSAAGAWSPAQLIDEAANGAIVATTTPWNIGSVTLAATTDVALLDYLDECGVLTHVGDDVLIDDEGQEIRMAELTLDAGCGGVRIMAASGKTARLNFSTIAADWALVDGQTNVWQIACDQANSCLWDNGAWLAKVQSATTATIVAACAAALVPTYGFDGTNLILGLPVGTPDDLAYEFIGAKGGLNASACANLTLKNLTLAKAAAFRNTDNNADAAPYLLSYGHAGLTIIDGIVASYGAKHVAGSAVWCKYPRGSRLVVKNMNLSHGAPYTYVGNGGQMPFVWMVDRGNSTSSDNQILLRNITSVLSAGVEGSSVSVSDEHEPGAIFHDEGGSSENRPFTQVLFVGCKFWNTAVVSGTSVSANPWLYTADCDWGGGALDPVEGAVSLAAVQYLVNKRMGFGTDVSGNVVALGAQAVSANGGHGWMPWLGG